MASKTDIRTVQRYAAVLTQKMELEASMKEVKQKLAKLEEQTLDYFERQGVGQVKVDGITLFPRREVHGGLAGDTKAEDVVQACHAAGMGELAPVKLSWPTVSALLRERAAEGEEMVPPELKGLIVAHEKFKIGYRA